MNKRTRLAAVAIFCFAVLGLLLVCYQFKDLTTNPVFSFVFKMAVATGVLWLAWPDLVRLQRYFPPKMLFLAPLSIAALLIQPRFGAGLIFMTIAYWVGWLIYRKIFPAAGKPTKKSSGKRR